MAYIITASATLNGTTIDTSNHESLGDWYGYEFATEEAADDVCTELEFGDDADTRITYTVEDIGITYAEVGRKSADEWWGILVGQQTPAAFMECSESENPHQAAWTYLVAVEFGTVVTVADDDARTALARKLASVIDAQA